MWVEKEIDTLAAAALLDCCISSLWSLGQTLMKSELFTSWWGSGDLGGWGAKGRTGGGRLGGAGGVKTGFGIVLLAGVVELLIRVGEGVEVLLATRGVRSCGTRDALCWASKEGTDPSAKLSDVPSGKNQYDLSGKRNQDLLYRLTLFSCPGSFMYTYPCGLVSEWVTATLECWQKEWLLRLETHQTF